MRASKPFRWIGYTSAKHPRPETRDPGPPRAEAAQWQAKAPQAPKTEAQDTEAAHTYTQTYTYIQGARNVAHVHPLTPAPNHTQIPILSPIQHTRAAEPLSVCVCVRALSSRLHVLLPLRTAAEDERESERVLDSQVCSAKGERGVCGQSTSG